VKALVLEEKGRISLRDIDLYGALGPGQVRVRVTHVGICGSDVHYYTHGRIGPFVVDAPMVLGHEAAGYVVECAPDVTHLKPGDRVCVEPGVPRPFSPETLAGRYNLDPGIFFWATPPDHGCLCESVVHPAAFCLKLPDALCLSTASLAEPLAVGVFAAGKAGIRLGETVLVTGAGPIGLVTAASALASGASHVFITDVSPEKLAFAAGFLGDRATVLNAREPVEPAVLAATAGRGASCIFEASGSPRAYAPAIAAAAMGARMICIGMPVEPLTLDLSALIAKEIRLETCFRYANAFGPAVSLLASKAFDFASLVTCTFPFDHGVEAFAYAATAPAGEVKIQIVLEDAR
jgi:D-xylulose reductase